MSNREVREALNEGMLEASQTACDNGDFEDAFESVLAVLDLEPGLTRAHAALLKSAVRFFESRQVQSRLSLRGPLPWHPGNVLSTDEVAGDVIIVPIETTEDIMELIDNSSFSLSPFLLFDNDEKHALLAFSRDVAVGGWRYGHSLMHDEDPRVRPILTKIALALSYLRHGREGSQLI